MSDVCAMVWTLAALCAAMGSRRRWPWSFAAGVAVAIAVLVRPSNVFLLFPWRWRSVEIFVRGSY